MSTPMLFSPFRGRNYRANPAPGTPVTVTMSTGFTSMRVVVEAGAVGNVVWFATFKASDQTVVGSILDTPVLGGTSFIMEIPADHDRLTFLASGVNVLVNFQLGQGGY